MGKIETIISGKIATLLFFHPSSNSFPSTLLQQLTDEITVLGNNKSISLIVLKSSGTGPFCAGASFDELLSINSFEEGIQFFSGFANVINAMRKCPKLIIGRIHGKAVGGGVGLAAACDYSFATLKSEIKLSEIP
jgi:methylglutaconyl-CoA hydratase